MEANACAQEACQITSSNHFETCNNCNKMFHIECLAEMGREPEDMSEYQEIAQFNNVTEVYFCSVFCMLNKCTR